jgi:uncharacterized protein (TIGR02147 family)
MRETPILSSHDFRLWLQQELLRRCRANPKYSLRAFASFLKVEPSELSKILNGKRSISSRKFEQFCERLSLDPEQRRGFLGKAETRASENEASYQQLSLDSFQVIAEWHHYAILELTTVVGFKSDPSWVGNALGISVHEVKAAVERLERLGFLEVSPGGRWIDRSGNITTVGNEFTALAFRKLQKAVLEKALVALEETPFNHRDQSSMTMAIDVSLLPEAKERIRKFRRSLCAFLQNGKKRDHVYQLGVSLYPLTRIPKEKRK